MKRYTKSSACQPGFHNFRYICIAFERKYAWRKTFVYFLSCFTWIVSSKSSVNIAVASWFTAVVSESIVTSLCMAFKRNYVRRKTFGIFLGFFACFRWIISSKSSVNISVASWLTTVASELWFIRGVFKRKFFPAFLTTTRIASADVYKWDSLAIVDRCMALEFWTAYTLWICPLWLRIIKSVYGGRIFEPRWWGCICNSVDGDSIFEPRWQDYIYNFAFESVNGGSI